MTQQQIGELWGVTTQRVQQIEAVALKKMREELERDPAIRELVETLMPEGGRRRHKRTQGTNYDNGN